MERRSAAHVVPSVPARGVVVVRACLRLASQSDPFESFDELMGTRRSEADALYTEVQSDLEDPDARLVQRQALAGNDLEQTILLLRRSGMAQGRPATAAASLSARAWTQFRVEAPQQRRHHLNAG